MWFHALVFCFCVVTRTAAEEKQQVKSVSSKTEAKKESKDSKDAKDTKDAKDAKDNVCICAKFIVSMAVVSGGGRVAGSGHAGTK
jgi:hypothetical protein